MDLSDRLRVSTEQSLHKPFADFKEGFVCEPVPHVLIDVILAPEKKRVNQKKTETILIASSVIFSHTGKSCRRDNQIENYLR